MHFSMDRTALTTAIDGPIVDHWSERKIAKTTNAFAVQNRSDDPDPHVGSPGVQEIWIHGFETWLSQTNDLKIDGFLARCLALLEWGKNWLAVSG